MDKNTFAKVAEGVARHEYSLLLGAGASIGSLGGNGKPLPSGPQLKDRLIEDFDIATDGQDITLSRAYEAAERRDTQGLRKYIESWFTGCVPSWQHVLTEFDWHRIWTLNVDDIIERVYADKQIPHNRFNWTSRFRDKAYSGLQIVHLHGFADSDPSSGGTRPEMVFSINDYLATMNDRRAWHTVFTDEFSDRPFIILGASLVEEFDLRAALAGSASETAWGFPSVIVLNRVSSLEREELSALGLLIVEMDAHQFIKHLQKQVQQYLKQVRDAYGSQLSLQIQRFLQQFTDLRHYQPREDENTRNFYLGYEPHWKNILDEDDALLEATMRAVSNIRRNNGTDTISQDVYVLTGTAGSGKSTGLLRIARSFIADGRPVFQFRGDEELDVDAVIAWLERFPDTTLFFNDCADFGNAIGDLAETCDAAGLPLLAIGTERNRRRSILERTIDDRFLHMGSEYAYRLLSNRDVDALIEKLSSRRRLGQITRINRTQQRNYFTRTASRRLFEGMANLEGGEGFRIRMKNEYRQIPNENLRRLYAASSIAYQIGYPLPLGIAAKVADLPVKDLEAWLISDDQDMMVIASNGVRLPHRLTATLAVESALSKDVRLDAMKSLALALAPHIDIDTIRRSTQPYRLLRRLMDQELVLRLVDPVQGREFYEFIQSPYDWNGRYWEQRALFESNLGNHPQARSYAEHSLQIHRHPFAFNTLGTILGRIALQDGNVNILQQAISNLERARDEPRWEASEHPYTTYFRLMINFGMKWGISAIPGHLLSTFSTWYNQARVSRVFSGPRGDDELSEFNRDWLHLIVQHE